MTEIQHAIIEPECYILFKQKTAWKLEYTACSTELAEATPAEKACGN